MTWLKPKHMPSFLGAEAIYESGPWLIAKWNHDQCVGWNLYSRPDPQTQRTRWLLEAGAESLTWSDERAQRWAAQQVAEMGK